MDKLLTISIAAYNMELYIENTLENLAQKEIVDKLEVFIVDDGGTDNTLNIAKKYQEKYPNTFHAVHKENGGYGTTVNYSIERASGKYFKLLDGDDWFDAKGIKELLYVIEKETTDIVVTNYYSGVDQEHLTLSDHGKEFFGKIHKIREIDICYPLGMWSLTYRTEILRKSNLKLPAHVLYTDQYYATIPFAYAETIQYLDFGVYCYRIGRDGQSVSKESRIKHCDEALGNCSALCKFVTEVKNTPNYAYILKRVTVYYQFAIRTILLDKKNKLNFQKMINFEKENKDIAKDVYENAVRIGNMGKMIFLLRNTRYLFYWILRLFPNSIKNW